MLGLDGTKIFPYLAHFTAGASGVHPRLGRAAHDQRAGEHIRRIFTAGDGSSDIRSGTDSGYEFTHRNGLAGQQ